MELKPDIKTTISINFESVLPVSIEWLFEAGVISKAEYDIGTQAGKNLCTNRYHIYMGLFLTISHDEVYLEAYSELGEERMIQIFSNLMAVLSSGVPQIEVAFSSEYYSLFGSEDRKTEFLNRFRMLPMANSSFIQYAINSICENGKSNVKLVMVNKRNLIKREEPIQEGLGMLVISKVICNSNDKILMIKNNIKQYISESKEYNNQIFKQLC